MNTCNSFASLETSCGTILFLGKPAWEADAIIILADSRDTMLGAEPDLASAWRTNFGRWHRLEKPSFETFQRTLFRFDYHYYVDQGLILGRATRSSYLNYVHFRLLT